MPKQKLLEMLQNCIFLIAYLSKNHIIELNNRRKSKHNSQMTPQDPEIDTRLFDMSLKAKLHSE